MTFTPLKRNQTVLRILRYVARVLFFPFFDICVKGPENIPFRGAFVLLPKHQRWEDIPILGMMIKRPLYFMAKRELFATPLSNWFISALGGIPVDRKNPAANRNSIEMMLRFLKEGEGIVIFPEGTYHKDKMGPGRSGLIRMALSCAETVFIPVGIRYVRGGLRTKVIISIGKPAEDLFKDDPRRMTDLIMEEIAGLSGLAYEGRSDSET